MYIENMTIIIMMFVYERNKVKLDAQKIEEFMYRIFPNSKDDEVNKSTIERQYKKISEKYKDADIEGLKVSKRAVKIIGMK